MSVIEAIFNYLQRKDFDQVVPESYCPNCWGHQEYEGKFLKKIHEEKIDLNNLEDKRGWIQEYAVRHFEGIHLKETDDLFECPTCKLTYRKS